MFYNCSQISTEAGGGEGTRVTSFNTKLRKVFKEQ